MPVCLFIALQKLGYHCDVSSTVIMQKYEVSSYEWNIFDLFQNILRMFLINSKLVYYSSFLSVCLMFTHHG